MELDIGSICSCCVYVRDIISADKRLRRDAAPCLGNSSLEIHVRNRVGTRDLEARQDINDAWLSSRHLRGESDLQVVFLVRGV